AGAVVSRSAVNRTSPFAQATGDKPVVARAAATTDLIGTTKTGAAYDQCKSAYFACMDQFCANKNASFQRCSCSDRVYDMIALKQTMQNASDQLTQFTNNMDVVGMTAAQATATKKAAEGETALQTDASASKALLDAIMNSISGADATVSGKLSGLNVISIPTNTGLNFGVNDDSGQAIATYNGNQLYLAVYGNCRQAVRGDCNDAALQRAVTAYLMAVEQDCNTVQNALAQMKKQLAAGVRQSAAMLDLARVQNHQDLNSLNAAACLDNVEKAILDEQACGAGYHKCLDNGQFIDVTTGKPFTGVVNFYQLAQQLTFDASTDIATQKLSVIPANKTFVTNFVNRTKKFAQPVLAKCTDVADGVWADYLDKAMLSIFYAQKAKVDEIKSGCMDFVAACYTQGTQSLTAAMQSLVTNAISAEPGMIVATSAMCKQYIAACDNMFKGTMADGVVAAYAANQKATDLNAACRAIADACFKNFGGSDYANLYSPTSGLFAPGAAWDWFTFDAWEYKNDTWTKNPDVVSKCAQQLVADSACNATAADVFGGFTKYINGDTVIYGSGAPTDISWDDWTGLHKNIAYTGVATEVYYKTLNMLQNYCNNYQGRFVVKQDSKWATLYKPTVDNLCLAQFDVTPNTDKNTIVQAYLLGTLTASGYDGKENICPKDYAANVDTQSWGACLCWENGGRRSVNGTSVNCVPGRYAEGKDRWVIPSTATKSGCAPSPTDDCTEIDPTIANKVCPSGAGGDKNTCDFTNPEPTMTSGKFQTNVPNATLN
ncbi:MAG: hypothetical protein FWC51_00245, partial [Proteobacteria bacterium]|nr:hypothetical protein [Pseudomonadota bacterium]